MKKFKYIFLFILFLILIFTINSNSYAFSLDNTYLQNGCPDNVVDFVLSSSFYKENNYTGFFIFDYSKYSNSYQVIMFYDNFSINFINNYTINESYKSGSSKNTFGVMGVKKDTFDILFTSPGNTSYSENMTLKNYFFTGVNSSLYINNSLAITTSATKYSPSFDITFSTAEKTTEPITAYSNYFDIEYFDKYKCYISTDYFSNTWEELKNVYTHTENGISQCRYYYYILKNGTYYFKFLNTETEEEYVLTRTVTNILKTSSNSGFNSSGIPQPFVTFERDKSDENYFILKTQSFSESDILKYKCLYTNSLALATESPEKWDTMENVGSINNFQLNKTEYYFYIRVPSNSEDCTYFFCFYDSKKNEYGNPSSLDCRFDKMNDYSDEVAGVVTTKKSKLNQLLDFFKARFGFLTYPFEFISDLLNRILNIEYNEPIINIPEIYIPNTDIKIFNGMQYNFNSILENQAISNIYNIYLIAVDFIIVIGVLILAKNTLLEVLGNG